MTEIYVIRHGETEWNRKKKIIGQCNPPLSPHGRIAIKKLAKKLSRWAPFDIIYSSNLKRAKESADIIALQVGYSKKIRVSKALQEIDYGILSGMQKEKAKQMFPQYHNNAAFIHPQGESFNTLYKRVVSFAKKLPKGKKILIITHAGCMRAVYSYFKKQAFKKNMNMTINHDMIMECSIGDQGRKKVIILQL
ncbi:histidine phosphatase family protein [Candidatus Woesearchaeota archaeon]|nr:histidine phosphatase family protein [Candidatus Woesearchaeota archaeon]